MISTQTTLFVESIEEALRDCVNALKGPKNVGVMLWPELSADRAGRDLADCLQPDAARKLSLDQIELLIRAARAQSCHAPLTYLCQANSYAAPVAVDPETEVQRLQREFIESQRQLTKLAEAINQKLADVASIRRAA